jgi:hypothetical protein
MRPRQGMQVKSIASGIVFALLLPAFASAQQPVPPQVASKQSQVGELRSSQPNVADAAEPPSANQSSADHIPDSPGTVLARVNQPPRTIPSSAQADSNPPSDTEPTRSQQSDSANAPPAQDPQASPASNDQLPDGSSQASPRPSAQSRQQQQTPHEPVGTAAAESVQTTGVAASRPAGAAVAPAKQRRARSILIKVGALVGAGVAVGTTMALSQGSPSKPPGSH